MIQVIILHSWWYASTSDQQDPWYFLGIAISLAQGIGLDQPSIHVTKDLRSRRLWRRIWWTIVGRDRIFAITSQKRIRIRDDEIQITSLTYSDFDTLPLTTTTQLLRDCPLATDCVSKVMSADLVMSQASLLLIGGQIVEQLYTQQGFRASTSEWAMYSVPKSGQHLDFQRYIQLQAALSDWSRSLNNYCRWDYHRRAEADHQVREALILQSAALRLLYLLVAETLNRPLAFTTDFDLNYSHGDEERNIVLEARKTVYGLAEETMEIIQALRSERLLERVSPISVTSILMATATCMIRNKIAGQSTDPPQYTLQDCTSCLHTIRGVWPVVQGTRAMVKRMAMSNPVWYARTLKMLDEPTPTEAGNAITRTQLALGTSCVDQSPTDAGETTNTIREAFVDRGEPHQARHRVAGDQTQFNSDITHLSSLPNIDYLDTSLDRELFAFHSLLNFDGDAADQAAFFLNDLYTVSSALTHQSNEEQV